MNSTNYIQNYLYGSTGNPYLSKRAGFSDLAAGLPRPEELSDLQYNEMHNKAKFAKDMINSLVDYYDKEKMNPVQYFLHKNKDDLMTYGGLGAGALGLGVGGLALYLRHRDKKKKEKEMEELGLGKEAATKASLFSRIGAGIKDLMSTPLSKKQMLKVLKNSAPKNATDTKGIQFAEKYNAANKAERIKLIKDKIYDNRIKAIKALKPTLNEGLIGTSGLGLGLLLGSNSGTSEE